MNKTTRNLMIGFGAVTGLVLIGAVVAAGWMQRSLWSVPLLACVFSVLYIYGKQPQWKKLISEKPVMVVPSFLSTYAAQTIMCGVFYLIGYGAKSVFGEVGERAPISTFDYQLAGGLLAAGLVLGTIVNQFTKRIFADLSSILDETRTQLDDAQASLAAFTGAPEREHDITLTGSPVTPDSLISGRHFSHAAGDPDPDTPGANNELAAGSDAKIAETEARLGRELPESLRAIYRMHNGGSINDVCIPNDDAHGNELSYDDVLMPFSGYNDLLPLERIETAWELFTHFGDPEDKENYDQFFRSGTQNMLVLAMSYQETLFLDYNEPGNPRVGFVDFDHENWEDQVISTTKTGKIRSAGGRILPHFLLHCATMKTSEQSATLQLAQGLLEGRA